MTVVDEPTEVWRVPAEDEDDPEPHDWSIDPAIGRSIDQTRKGSAVPLRPLVASWLTSVSAALLVGGIFDSWSSRLLGVAAAALGTAAVALTLRSRRQTLLQLAFVPALLLSASLLLVGTPGGPSTLGSSMRAALDAGRLLHPPVPFDPGWRPIVFMLIAAIAFAAGWIGAALERPLLGAIIPLPLALMAAFTQPSGAEFLAAVFIFMPLLAALGVLFSASRAGSDKLDLAFEVRRAAKAGVFAVPALGLLLAFNSASFLFPEPTYDPNDKPQKPKAMPLSAETDRVLFSVQAPPGFSGPWRTGVLDVYEDGTFKLPGQSAGRLQPLPAGGVVDAVNAAKASLQVKITTGNLGDSPILPMVPTAAKVILPPDGPDVRIDNRTGVMRVPAGRAPSGLAYEIDLPPYPNAQQLGYVPAPSKATFPADDFVAPDDLPPAVERVLRAAPPSGWARLDYVRHQLLDHITAAGPGAPVPMDGGRVQEMLDGSKKGTPFEIVAAQVLLARWAGFPARIGYGFNGFNDENGQSVIRPKNAAQWLEVGFPGYGFVPLLDKPPKADTTLDNPKKTDQDVVASDEVAVQLFLPVSLPRPVPLFELVRARLLQALPLVIVLLALRAVAPQVVRALRRRRREEWARARGPRERVAVAYADFRDAATDLNVGDPFATPIEFLARVDVDHDHTELAWVVSRSMYGDMAVTLTDDDAEAAEELSRSLQRRLRAGQPTQVQLLAFLTQASLRKPYSDEVPNMTLPAPGPALSRKKQAIQADLAARRRRRRLRRETGPRRARRRVLPIRITGVGR